jgi:hypothetical protein
MGGARVPVGSAGAVEDAIMAMLDNAVRSVGELCSAEQCRAEQSGCVSGYGYGYGWGKSWMGVQGPSLYHIMASQQALGALAAKAARVSRDNASAHPADSSTAHSHYL